MVENTEEIVARLTRILVARFRTSPLVLREIESYVQEGITRTLNQGYDMNDRIFLPYAVRCAVNAIYDFIADKRREINRETADPPSFSGADPERAALQHSFLERGLARISGKCYNLLLHIYYLGEKVSELVPRFGPNPHAVSQLKVRCLARLREVCAP